MADFDKEHVASILNGILEQELAGVVRYTHYSFLIFGHGRIPIVSWLREQANESLLHAQQAGEMITHLGAYPSLEIGPLLDNNFRNFKTKLGSRKSNWRRQATGRSQPKAKHSRSIANFWMLCRADR